jgi:alkylated DNA nucleotide flippase Atl1
MSLKNQVFDLVNSIPEGKVVYYGMVSNLLSQENQQIITAQMIGWILSGMKEDEYDKCAWQRVVAKNGYISTLKLGGKGFLQIQLLENEGITVIDNTVDMLKYCLTFDEFNSLTHAGKSKL